MSTEKSVRQFATEWNAEIEAKGMLLKQDPWAMPEIYSGSVLDPPTPEGIERTAKLRQERLARADAAQRAVEQVTATQDVVQEQCRGAVKEEMPT